MQVAMAPSPVRGHDHQFPPSPLRSTCALPIERIVRRAHEPNLELLQHLVRVLHLGRGWLALGYLAMDAVGHDVYRTDSIRRGAAFGRGSGRIYGLALGGGPGGGDLGAAVGARSRSRSGYAGGHQSRIAVGGGGDGFDRVRGGSVAGAGVCGQFGCGYWRGPVCALEPAVESDGGTDFVHVQ